MEQHPKEPSSLRKVEERHASPATRALLEFHLEFLTGPGTYVFSVKNDGTIEHNFVLPGQSARIDGIQVGETKTLTARLTPGTYTVLCDTPGHAEAGMKTTLSVK